VGRAIRPELAYPLGKGIHPGGVQPGRQAAGHRRLAWRGEALGCPAGDAFERPPTWQGGNALGRGYQRPPGGLPERRGARQGHRQVGSGPLRRFADRLGLGRGTRRVLPGIPRGAGNAVADGRAERPKPQPDDQPPSQRQRGRPRKGKCTVAGFCLRWGGGESVIDGRSPVLPLLRRERLTGTRADRRRCLCRQAPVSIIPSRHTFITSPRRWPCAETELPRSASVSVSCC